jgi:hypothetical protein
MKNQICPLHLQLHGSDALRDRQSRVRVRQLFGFSWLQLGASSSSRQLDGRSLTQRRQLGETTSEMQRDK